MKSSGSAGAANSSAAAIFTAAIGTMVDEPVALGAIAHLIVILQAEHEPLAPEVGAGGATRTTEVLRCLALVGEPFGQRAPQPLAVGEIDVVAALLAREPAVHSVMEVVRPDGVQPDAAFRGRQDDAPVVVVRLSR